MANFAPFRPTQPYNCHVDFRSEAKGDYDVMSPFLAVALSDDCEVKALVNKAQMQFVTESGSVEIQATINPCAA
jgi:hypothetical protein